MGIKDYLNGQNLFIDGELSNENSIRLVITVKKCCNLTFKP